MLRFPAARLEEPPLEGDHRLHHEIVSWTTCCPAASEQVAVAWGSAAEARLADVCVCGWPQPEQTTMAACDTSYTIPDSAGALQDRARVCSLCPFPGSPDGRPVVISERLRRQLPIWKPIPPGNRRKGSPEVQISVRSRIWWFLLGARKVCASNWLLFPQVTTGCCGLLSVCR